MKLALYKYAIIILLLLYFYAKKTNSTQESIIHTFTYIVYDFM